MRVDRLGIYSKYFITNSRTTLNSYPDIYQNFNNSEEIFRNILSHKENNISLKTFGEGY